MPETMTKIAPRADIEGGGRLMWLTPQRVFYAGLLGAAGERCLGGHGIYLSPSGRPNRIRIGGGAWQAGALFVVPPWVPHRVESGEPLIFNLLVEAESVDAAALPAFMRGCGPVEAPDVVPRVHAAHARLRAASVHQGFGGLDFDCLFFGRALAPRPLDARIRRVIERIVAEPSASFSAEQCAAEVQLSFSRFLHLFKQETGVTFRAFRAWKRARSLLSHVRQAASLTDIALDAGYPDSAHFSHSIRQVYGLTPSDIVAGSRRLALHEAPAAVML